MLLLIVEAAFVLLGIAMFSTENIVALASEAQEAYFLVALETDALVGLNEICG